MKCFVCWLVFGVWSAAAAILPLKITPLENHILWVQVAEVSEIISNQFCANTPTNPMSGLVLDLRQTRGSNDLGVANFFLSKKVPVVVLMDAETEATALATQLHCAGAVIIACGTNVPGKSMADIRVSLSDEDEKRFLENPFTNSITPTILTTSTNLTFYVDHTSEAELVRQRVKDGEEDNSNTPRSQPSQPVINDPALARAVDLLKALAIWKPIHS